MNMTAQDIGNLVSGEVVGDASRRISGAAGLEEAGPADVSFVRDARQAAVLEASKAGAVFVPRELLAKKGGVNGRTTYIVVEQPPLAFVHVLKILEGERRTHPSGVHPTAVIHPRAVLEAGVSVGALSVVEEGAVVGAGSRIYAQCYIGRGATLGA